jgi:hypothetical protein
MNYLEQLAISNRINNNLEKKIKLNDKYNYSR